MGVKYYRQLFVWRKGISLASEVYRLTKGFPSVGEVRSHESDPEGGSVGPIQHCRRQARKHTAAFRQFLYQALGSLAEVDTQLFLAQDLKYVRDEEVSEAGKLIQEIQKMIYTLLSRLPEGKSAH